jgi:hypothetical protein
MARYNEIQSGRFARAVQKLFGVKGEVPVASLAGEVVVAHSFLSGAENRYLEGWQRFGCEAGTGTPAAGNRSAIRIRNPVGSNVLAVIERFQIWEPTAADTPQLFFNGIATVMPTETGVASPQQLDLRAGQTGSNMIVSLSVNFGLIGSNPIWQASIPLNGTADIIITDIHELPLAPGSEYTIVSTTLVTQIAVNLLWRERFVEDSERA